MVDYARSTALQPVAERRAISRSSVLVAVLLLLTMIGGGYFRFVGQNWDDYVHFHPDERFLTSVASSLGRPLSPVFMTAQASAEENNLQYERCLQRNPDTAGEGGYFDTECSILNPHNVGHGLYVYGTLPLFLTRWSGDLLVEITGNPGWVSYEGIHLVWRFLSAVSDTLAILVVFAIGVHLHGRWVGLVSAMLYAAAVFPIQQAHFGTADAMTGLFVTLAILFAVRVQLTGNWADYALFGTMLGAALASRVNIAPLAGLVILAAIMQVLPAFDHRAAGRRQVVWFHIIGLAIAGLLALVWFRVLNPYAFMGPGILGLMPNPAWLADVGEAQRLVSGHVEMPPNWQWVGRPSYIFPLSNMILWGMGVPLGVTAWVAWAVAGFQLLRGRLGATRNLLLVVWVLVYFGWLGGQWVMTMRYYLPIYPALALLAGWGLVHLVRRVKPGTRRHILARAVLVGVVALTFLWALMFTNVYRHLFTSVQGGLWIWENAPGDFAMEIDGAPSDTPLVNIAFGNNLSAADMDLVGQATRYENGGTLIQSFVAPASGTITTVFAPHLADPNDDPDDETLRISIYSDGSVEPAAQGIISANLTREANVLGDGYTIQLTESVEVVEGQRYSFSAEAVAGPIVSGGSIFAWEGDWDEATPAKACQLPPGVTLADDPAPGYSTAETCNGRDPWFSLINGYKLQMIYDDVAFKRDRMQEILDNTDYLIIGTNRRYDSQNRIPTKWPMTERYYDALFSGELGFELAAEIQETFELGPLKISDQYLPTYNAPKWLNEFEAEEAFHVYDHPAVFIFRKTDAYTPENTAEILGSVPLNNQGVVNLGCPEAQAYPKVNFYCDSTLVGVYQLTGEGLDVSLAADQATTALMFPDEMLQTQTDGGTWSNRFDAESLLNTQPVLMVVVWWMAMLLFGWAVWPLLFVALPGLADRGYGFAKTVGLVLTAFLAWLLASARIPVWTQFGVLGALLVVAAVSLYIGWRAKAGIIDYIYTFWGRLLAIEIITLLLFVLFLGVRLANPDLWHPAYGGEKPMDFAYFTGVLRSTVFPPINPWYGGAYINYYYFGYVIVGAPVLLLGVVPSVAYNLILPTLFALTGIGAFSVAFNLVGGWRERRVGDSGDDSSTRRRVGNPWLAGIAALLLTVVLGNLDTPRVMLTELARIGGFNAPASLEDYLVSQYVEEHGFEPTNQERFDLMTRAAQADSSLRIQYELDVFGEALASVGRGIGNVTSGQQIHVSPDRWFWGPTRVLDEPPVRSGGAIAEMPYFTFLYGDLHAHMIAMPLQLFVMAFVANEILSVEGRRRGWRAGLLAIILGGIVTGLLRATNTWDWPTFTALGVAGLAFTWWLRWRGAARDIAQNQGVRSGVLVVGLGLLLMGVLATLLLNEPSRLPLLMFGGGGGLLAWWLFWGHVTRRSVMDLAWRVGGFVLVGMAAVIPYTSWYASNYNRVLPYVGNRTPLWAYGDVHGLFLFLIFSLLVWDTGRWLHGTYVRSLRGRGRWLLAGLVCALVLVAGALALSTQSYQVALIVVPLLAWIALLFFRSGQSRAMQIVLALSGLALALTLAVEFVALEGDLGRMNTVFKFYIQVWLLFGVAGGAAFAWLWQNSERWSGFLRAIWSLALFLLVFVAALYPFMATAGKLGFRYQWPSPLLTLANYQQGLMELLQWPPEAPLTLNGMDYMRYATQWEGTAELMAVDPSLAPFPLEDDYDMIRWLQDNVQGSPVIMEGRSEREYLWGSRISIYTGLPSVVGWNWHQRQQRTLNPLPRLVEQRVANVNAFYVTSSIDTAWDMIQFYDVEYVILGRLEHAYYPASGLAKFDRMAEAGLLEIVYHKGASIIYRVNPDATPDEVRELARLDQS